MKKILILGANGQIARFAIDLLLQTADVQLTLYLRKAKRLHHLESDRVHVIEGDVMDQARLEEVMVGHRVVYANLAGDLARQAQTIVNSMEKTGLKRLIFISSMGIYDEVPGERYSSILDPYRKAASIIEQSNLDYTIVRPAWLNNRDEIDYETTAKGEPFRNADAMVSRKSVAHLVVKLALQPGLEVRSSLGVNKP